jgi:hypothetical protein
MQNPSCYAVIGGWDYEGECFHSLRLFDCKSAAVEYGEHLKDDGFDYVKMDVLLIEQLPALNRLVSAS